MALNDEHRTLLQEIETKGHGAVLGARVALAAMRDHGDPTPEEHGRIQTSLGASPDPQAPAGGFGQKGHESAVRDYGEEAVKAAEARWGH